MNYLNKILEPIKESWATCYINKFFTCGINSTQRVESLNRLLKDTVRRNFLLCQLTNEIQSILDNEAKYERITNMHNALPKQNLDDIPTRFFGEINDICKEFLTSHILAMTQKQMKQSFFYDAYIIDQKYIEQVWINL